MNVHRPYDGYVYQGEVVSQTKATMDIQLPGYIRPVRFFQSRLDPNKLRHSSGLYVRREA